MVRVLLVEDDEDDYLLTRDLFQQVGEEFEIHWIRDYDQALAAILKNEHDVCLLDYRLGKHSGLELLEAAVARGATCPMIVLTGQSERETDLAFMRAGAADFLVKGTLDAAILERSIRYALQHSRYQAELHRRVRERTAELAAINSALEAEIQEHKLTEVALRASEGHLRALIEATPECVKIVSPAGNLLQINKAGLRMIEADSETQVSGAEVADLIAPDDRDAWLSLHNRVCGGESLSLEFKIAGLRGTRRWMETHAVPLDISGHGVCQLGVTRDITERKRAEHERELLLASEQTARAEAERSGRIKDEFLATLSHELRTPLSAILGWSQLLQTQIINDPEIIQGIEVIERNARAQTKIIEDLLDMSRIVAGKVRLEVQHVDLGFVVNELLDTVRPAAEAKGIELRPRNNSLNTFVTGDPNRLQQVFWNLLSNAIKFTSRGGRVFIDIARVESHAEVRIEDSGEGISPEFLPYVFDRFRQADGTTTRRHGGLGLGLSIVKQLVELHGGNVSVSSAGLGKGAMFVIAIPLRAVTIESSVPDPESQLEDIQHRTVFSRNLEGIRILVVDDEHYARQIVKRLVSEAGADVRTASSASEALQMIDSFRPDILLSDIGMPGEDGYSLIRKLREHEDVTLRSMPALALTAYARPEDRARAVQSGYQIHLAKPVQASELLTTLASLTGRDH